MVISYRLGDRSAAWLSAHRRLLQNVQRHPFIPHANRSSSNHTPDANLKLPAYIPYIGPHYFSYRPRVLCYGINQNLSQHAPWTTHWVASWSADPDLAIDRLNRAASQGGPLPIKPYAEGFIPLAALIIMKGWLRNEEHKLPELADEVLAVTNFVKFSTFKDASSSSIPSCWWRECGVRYVELEIGVLRPDIIIAFGQKTFAELQRVLGQMTDSHFTAELFNCRFPARMASIKSRSLSSKESAMWANEILPLVQRIGRPKHGSFHKWKINQYPRYFLDLVFLPQRYSNRERKATCSQES